MKNHHYDYHNTPVFSTGGHCDPVCGMVIDYESETIRIEYEGQFYHFCSEHCRRAFRNNPQEFLEGESPDWDAVRQEKPLLGRPYTCPVHKGVIQDCPGKCYQCGSTLELVPPFTHDMSSSVQ